MFKVVFEVFIIDFEHALAYWTYLCNLIFNFDYRFVISFRATLEHACKKVCFFAQSIFSKLPISKLITRLVVIDIVPLTVLFCNCPLADL